MLREIPDVRQESGQWVRRWFQDENFDLYLWQDGEGTPVAFQLCYQRGSAQGAISWHPTRGFTHARVDCGHPSLRHAMSPILRPAASPPYFRIYARFLDATLGWEPRLRAFLLERLRGYRTVLFGAPRKPRRRRR